MDTESLFSHAANLSVKIGSKYKNTRNDRWNLLEFMDANDWFDLEYSMQGQEPMMPSPSLSSINRSLTLWLSAYKRRASEKLAILLEHFKAQYPQTCHLYQKFISDRQMADDPSAWKLLDFLFFEIDREITGYTETDLEKLVRLLESEATRTVAKTFANFLATAKKDGKPLSRWNYAFEARDNPDLINTAYSLSDFATMAYCVFNEEMWIQQDMVKKAIQNKSYADLWLFAALHFICALRSSDMTRLPAPALQHDCEITMDMIATGAFPEMEATALTDELVIRLKLKPMKPSKTSAYEKVPDIKLFVPQSLRTPLGTIIAITLAHHPEIRPGDGFVKPNTNLANIRGLFGDHFVKALSHRRLSPRRCNKSYLQGIAAIADDAPGKPKGYMIAALARSHKAGIGSIAETTDIYLKDAQFTGYSPEFIVKQMFERGVFSFIPAVLLEIYAGKGYTQLPVTSQTRLIGALGLEATQIERLAVATEQAVIKSRNTVYAILEDPAAIKENVADILQNIASGYARGKQEGYLCLMTASGHSCAYAVRSGCIGCEYEIFTKAAIHSLMEEYTRLSRHKNAATESEAWRFARIIEKAVLPAITEMICAIRLLYPESDMTEMLNIIEEGLNLVDGYTGRNERHLQPVNGGLGN